MAADLLRAPKTSIFEQTQPGLAPAGPRRRSWDPFAFLRATHAPAAAPPPTEPPEALRERLRRPSRSVALPTLPDPDPALAQLLEDVLAEASGRPPVVMEPPLPEEVVTRPVVVPIPMDATTRQLPEPALRLPRWAFLAAGLALVCVAGMGTWTLVGPKVADPVPSLPPEIAALRAQAENGDVAAMRLLGLRYAYGLQVPADPVEAARWLGKAAQAGSSSARKELAALRRAP